MVDKVIQKSSEDMVLQGLVTCTAGVLVLLCTWSSGLLQGEHRSQSGQGSQAS